MRRPPSWMFRLLGALILATSMLAATPARARTEWIVDKTYKTERPTHLDFVGSAWPFGITRFGGAVWFGLPILEQGFIPLNDVLDLEVGAFFVYISDDHGTASFDYFAIGPMGGVRWGLDLTEDWQVFLTAKAGARLGIGDNPGTAFLLSFTLGALWEFSKSMYLRLETGNYGIIQAGVTIPF